MTIYEYRDYLCTLFDCWDGSSQQKERKMKMDNRTFIDMDGVLAKFHHVASEEQLYEQGYFANLEPMPTVINGVKQYIAEHPESEIHILSAYLKDSSYALQEKNQWLDTYLPEINADHRIFCPCGEPKANYIQYGIEDTDILLDDYTKNLLDWKVHGGLGVKLLNGINHTRGTWEGFCVDYQNDDINFALQNVIKNVSIRKEWNQIMDKPFQISFMEFALNNHLSNQPMDINELTSMIDNYVEYWHTHDTGNSLEDFLGFTNDEYNRLITGDNQVVLSDILKCRTDQQKEIPINKENFPDDVFRSYLIEQFGTVLTQETIKSTKQLILAPIDEGHPGICDLTGIEYFTALEILDCNHHSLTKLDVSRNSELKYLDCGYNHLTALDVSHNPHLTELICCCNDLKSLDLRNNPSLTYLSCASNHLTELDLSRNPALKELRCSENMLESLDVSKNPHITKLMCMNNHLHTLDISNNTSLEKLFCDHNQLSQLDVNKNVNLRVLVCSHNHLGSLDVAHNSLLKELSCIGNRTRMRMDMSNNPLLYGSDILKRNPGVIPITKWPEKIKKEKHYSVKKEIIHSHDYEF